MASNDNNKRK
jgi:hypothetical protein